MLIIISSKEIFPRIGQHFAYVLEEMDFYLHSLHEKQQISTMHGIEC